MGAIYDDKGKQTFIQSNPGYIITKGSPILAAGKTTATLTDNVITPSSSFNRISIINDGPSELRICIDGNSTNLSNNIIYIKPSEAFDDTISGSTIHFSVESGSATLRYVIR